MNQLIDPSFQGTNRLFVLSFENDAHQRSYKRYFLPTVEIKDCNVMIDGKNIWHMKTLITYENIRKIATGQGDNYTTGCLLEYNYFKIYYRMIAIDLNKLQALDPDPKAIQQINFTANLDRKRQTAMYFIIEEAKKAILDFSQGTVRALRFYFVLI